MKHTREGKPTTYIHYGSPAFDDERFMPAVQEGYWVKPKGGLWGSPVDAQHSWKDWCEGESFRECKEEESFKFTARDPKRIFYIDSEEAFDDWYSRYVTSISGGMKFSFVKGFNCGLDQIEVDKKNLLLWRIPGNMRVVNGFVYSRDNKDEVKKLAGTNDPFTDTRWHCYPVSYTEEQGMVLSNMDPELNPWPLFYSSESLMSNVIFYFVTHTDIEKEFGLDVDGDYLRSILRPENYKSEEFNSILERIWQ